MIIGISSNGNGKGKDLVGKIIQHFNPTYEIVKFASAVNESYKLIKGIDFSNLSRFQKEKHRADFIKYAEGVKDVLGEDVWVDALFKDYNNNNWIITDVRFENEYNFLLQKDYLHIHIQRLEVGDMVVWKDFIGTDLENWKVLECKDEVCKIQNNHRICEIEYKELASPIPLLEHLKEDTVYIYNNLTISQLVDTIESTLKNHKI
jgi:hypothetical protein